ncbi:MAG: hypothetical protein JWM21_4088 [Acidobacteria bacterium]|nr:hypothetical protein [Acidobacteriota bacterium]
MSQVSRLLSLLFWVGGMIAIVLAVLWRLLPPTRFNHNVEVRSLVTFAAVLFLGAIASWAVGQTSAR